MKIITAGIKYWKQMCEYANKKEETKAQRKYHTYRKFVCRQLEKYDRTKRSHRIDGKRFFRNRFNKENKKI